MDGCLLAQVVACQMSLLARGGELLDSPFEVIMILGPVP
jgi:hypothetical protein